VEEFYDRKTDPDCLTNRVGNADYQQHLTELRSRLRTWLAETKDSTLPAFDRRNDAAALEQFMQRYLERAQHQMQQRRIYEEANGYRF
ncbi:MAG: hypothetical protein VB875_09675, partial [Pirellulales bacterium]